jgi:hypothetical protein
MVVINPRLIATLQLLLQCLAAADKQGKALPKDQPGH